MRAFSLFSGAGGLDLGAALAGFDFGTLIDWNASAIHTLERNRNVVLKMKKWRPLLADATAFDFASVDEKIDLLTAGASCQPFSQGGKHQGSLDERNVFPTVVRAVNELRPQAILIENVSGILRERMRPYFDHLCRSLEYVSIEPRQDESWEAHDKRLLAAVDVATPDYVVAVQQIDAADFGVPQRRRRVIVIAYRADLAVEWAPLKPTHSRDALLYDQYVSGDYWREHRLRKPPIPSSVVAAVERLGREGPPPGLRWRTVRDATGDLPDPTAKRGRGRDLTAHEFVSGARTYPGHSGSGLDEPAKTVKAGVHGVPGGENMLRLSDGSVRYFTMRELARLQGFPDEYLLPEVRLQATKQIGNAVPVAVAREFAVAIRSDLERSLSSLTSSVA